MFNSLLTTLSLRHALREKVCVRIDRCQITHRKQIENGQIGMKINVG